MSQQTKNNPGQINIEIGEPVLTRYERARIVGARALQISHGAPVLIDTDQDEFETHTVALKELRARVLPIGLSRRVPNGQAQNIPVHRLKDREFITQIDTVEPATGKKTEKKDKPKAADKPKRSSASSDLSLDDISGIGESTASDLKDAGFGTVESIANSSVKELTKIQGIGKKTAEKYIERAKELL